MARGRKRKKTTIDPFQWQRPTVEREAHNDIETMGMARRIKPVIVSLLETRQITQAQFDALDYYREQAHKAQDDEAQESPLSPAKIMGGTGGRSATGTLPKGILLATPAILETARIERDLGGLQPIARAIAVDDVTLARWCIAKHGGRERLNGRGKLVAIVPTAEKRVIGLALIELKYAAGRIVR